MKNNKIVKMVFLALMLGLNIVFSRILPPINAWNIKISITFITYVITGNIYGPFYSALIGGLGDFIGALAFPIGEYNPLFTITAIASGFVFGFFRKDNMKIGQVLIECLVNNIFVTLLLNSYFIAIAYNSSYKALLASRIIQAGVMLVIQIVLITLLRPVVEDLSGRSKL